MSKITRLKQMLRQVGLYNLAKDEFELKDEKMSNLDYLELLITKEIQMREQKNIYKRNKASALLDKNFEDFDIEQAKGINNWQIDKLTTLEFLEEQTNIIIIGSAGVGKTHVASSIGNVAVKKGVKTIYVTMLNLLKAITLRDKKSEKLLNYIKECQLVLIDEFGYTKLNETESQQAYHYLTNLNRMKSLVIITNKDFNNMSDMFSEKLLANTLLDRLTENSQLIYLTGQSYRQRNHNKIF